MYDPVFGQWSANVKSNKAHPYLHSTVETRVPTRKSAAATHRYLSRDTDMSTSRKQRLDLSERHHSLAHYLLSGRIFSGKGKNRLLLLNNYT